MSVQITVGQELQGIVDMLEEKAPGALFNRFSDRLQEIVAEARDRWPVKTGASQRALRIRAAKEDGKVYWIIEDRMPYAGAIEFKHTNENVSEALVFEPIEEMLDEMLEEFAEELLSG